MRRGLDTNVLIYAHLPAFEQHGRVRRYLHEQLCDPDVTLVLTPSILHEFIHIVTDARRFDQPLTMAEASSIAHLYLGKENLQCLGVDEEILIDALRLIEIHQLGRKRLADTLFAALLRHHGVAEVISCNPKDFACFDGLTVIDPTQR